MGNYISKKREERMADIDAVIRKCVDDIWAEYDKDNSGSLDKDETKKFVQNTLAEMNDSGEFSEEDFEQCFKEFDKDGSGTIEKDEMAIFIKKALASERAFSYSL